MKFILSMIICSSVYNSCLPPHNLPELYNSHYECMMAGFEEAMNKTKEIGPTEVNKYGTVIKFICVDENLFLPKTKGNNV
tara:strand:+ start:405 stop:644 length:240 start_codon:yes stop_codon:yes gene_type:complete